MKMFYSAPNSLLVGHVRNLLEVEGIECELKNEFLAGGMGELPPTEAWPELWIDEKDLSRAQQLLDAFQHEPAVVLPEWKCPNCGEQVEGQFSACWNCGADRPSSAS